VKQHNHKYPEPFIVNSIIFQVFDFEEDCQEMFTTSRVSRLLVEGARGETADVMMAQLSDGKIYNEAQGFGDRMGIQQIRLTLREIFTELETHRTKLDKLIDNWDEQETTEIFNDDGSSSRDPSIEDDDD